MRGKVAKALRRQAERMTVGKPTISYSADYRMGANPQVEMHPDCTRRTYQILKKIYKKKSRNLFTTKEAKDHGKTE